MGKSSKDSVHCLLRSRKSEHQFVDLRTFETVRHKFTCRHCKDVLHGLGLYHLVLTIYGMKDTAPVREAFDREFYNLHYLSKAGLALKFWKYKTAAIFAHGFDQPLPEFPSELVGKCTVGPHIVGGVPHNFLARMKREVSSKDTKIRRRAWSAFNSLLMLKKGLPRPTASDCRIAAVKAYRTMTTEVQRKEGDAEVIERVGSRVEKVVQHLFGCRDWSAFWRDIQLDWPSVKSHFSSRRKDRGALGKLLEGLLTPESISYVEDLSDDLIVPADIKYRIKISEASIELLKKCQIELVEEALAEKPICSPQALPEPLKIRIVTAGPALLYTALRPIQQMMSNVLKGDSRFLYGVSISGEELKNRLKWVEAGKKWCSGDYQAATDNISRELSERAVIAIAKATSMPEDYVELLMRSLTGHTYTCEDFDSEEGGMLPYLPQLRGQLMGSPTSFPILCIINFALIWESVNPDVKFRDLQMLVNGDDCLFQCDDSQFVSWSQHAEAIGLKPSVGKTYLDSRFIVMNSSLYDFQEIDADTETPEVIPFINTGLLLGLKRSGDREVAFTSDDASQIDSKSAVGARARKLLEGFEWCDALLLDLFSEFNDLPDIPRFVPEVWGGLGLPETSQHRMPPCEYFYLLECVKEGFRFSLKRGGEVSPYYTNTRKGLIQKFGEVRREFDFSVGDLQWNTIKDRAIVQEDNCDDYLFYWSYKRALIEKELDDNGPEWFGAEPENFWTLVAMGPTKTIPGVWMTHEEVRVSVKYGPHGAYTKTRPFVDRNEVFVPSEPKLLSSMLNEFNYQGMLCFVGREDSRTWRNDPSFEANRREQLGSGWCG